jgi:succinoglycan biosynthesis protein ExoO
MNHVPAQDCAPLRPTPTVSVVIPVFNSAATLDRCVRSAVAQTLVDIEILIVDDGSTDTSADVADALAGADARIRVIRLVSNGGKSHAMNVAIDGARGEWVAVLDADDAIDVTRLARLLAAAEANAADLVADNLQYFDAGAGQILRLGFPSFATPRTLTTADLLLNNDSFGTFDFGLLKPMVRRSFIEDHGLHYYEKTRLCEDFYYLMNFFVAGGCGCLIGEALYCWTLPFGTKSRIWTTTGSGAWRYNYREALAANTHFMVEMAARGQHDVVVMLQHRAKQYRAMIHYVDAQRQASERRWAKAMLTILSRPSTYPLLCSRIISRLRRSISVAQAVEDP